MENEVGLSSAQKSPSVTSVRSKMSYPEARLPERLRVQVFMQMKQSQIQAQAMLKAKDGATTFLIYLAR